MIKRLFKWLLILLLVVFLLLLIAIGIAYYFAGTDQGFRYATEEAVARVDGLEIENGSGNLTEGISADALKYENDTILIKASDVETEWRTGCLLDKAFCLDKVFIDELYLEPKATEEKEKPETTDSIKLPEVKLPIALNAEELVVSKLRLKLPGVEKEHVLNDVNLKAFTNGSEVNLEKLTANYENFDVQLSGDFDLKDDYPLDAKVSVVATDVLEDHDFQVDATLSGSLAELNIVTTISDAVDLKLSGLVQPLEKNIPVDIEITTAMAGWPLDSMNIAKAKDLKLLVNGDMDDYAIELNTFVSGETIPTSEVRLKGMVNTERMLLPDTTVITLGGFATGATALSWTNDLTWFAELIAKDIDPSLQIPEITGRLNALVKANGSVVEGKWSLDLRKAQVDGELSGFPITLDTQLNKSLDDHWTVPRFELQNGANSVTANGKLDENWDVDALVKMPELQNFLPGLAGGFTINAQVGGKKLKPDVKLDADSKVFKFGEILVQGVKLNADIQSDATQQSDLTLSLNTVNVNGQKFSNTRLSLDGTQKKHKIKFFTDAPQKTALDLNATGGLSDTFDWIGQLTDVKVEVPAHNITLSDNADINWNNKEKTVTVSPHCWNSLSAKLCLENEVIAADTGIANVTLSNYPMNRLDPFLPANSTMKGQLSAESSVRWGKDQPGGFMATLITNLNNGGFSVSDDSFDTVEFNYESLNLNVKADGNKVSSKLLLDSKKLGSADIAVDLDPKTEGMPITGTVDLSGIDIGFVQAFVPQFETISGKINTIGNLSGSLTNPKFNGEVVLSDPIVRSADLPLSIDGGEIGAQIDGNRAVIAGAMDSGDGEVNLNGTANWERNPWRVSIDVTGDKLSIVQPPIESSQVFPKLTIRAQPGIIRVTGKVDIPSAVINVRNLPQGAASLSSDVVVVEDEIKEEAQKEKQQAGVETNLNVAVNVSLGDDVNLDAYGLEANLTGDIKVSIVSPNPPQLNGEIRVVEGIYQQYGQNLLVQDGQILFVGPIDRARLNMDAVREIESEERVAGLSLQGPLAEPEVTLFTEPADKPQESILSYIVLGRDINEASDQESNLLASAALALTLKGGRGAATNIAESIGIQDFALDARGNGDDTEVVVSGRLNDRLLLRYGRSVFSPQSTLYVRYDITKALYLEAAQGVEQAVDVFYSFSF